MRLGYFPPSFPVRAVLRLSEVQEQLTVAEQVIAATQQRELQESGIIKATIVLIMHDSEYCWAVWHKRTLMLKLVKTSSVTRLAVK